MLRRRRTPAIGLRSDQRGFTMVEMLVAMAGALVVSSALFTILDVTLRQTTRTASRVDATQRARVALESIGNQMRSACVEAGVVPIHKDSTATAVSYWSSYGNATEILPEKHTLSFDSGTGKLTDQTYTLSTDPVVSGYAPNWKKDSATLVSTETVLTNVAQSGTTPVFQYFSFAPPNGTATAVTPPLDEPESERTTEVRMTFVVKPTGGTGQNTNLVPNTVTNSVLLRLTPLPNPSTSNKDFHPCE